MQQKVKYNGSELLIKAEYSDTMVFKVINVYGYHGRTFWGDRKTILVFSTEWYGIDYLPSVIPNLKALQGLVPSVLKQMEAWYSDHQDAAKKVVLNIETEKSFLK